MSCRARLLIWFILALGSAQLAAAKERPDRNCTDDRGVDPCSAEQQRRVRDLFGVRSIEEHAQAGDQVRRAFYVDGYGRDVVAISFVRAPGRDPMLWVHFPNRDDEPRSEPLTAPVPDDVWRSVIERSAHFDRELVPLPGEARPKRKDAYQDIVMCIHSWVFTVEATDPPKGNGQQPTVRRRVEDACQNGLAEAYAGELRRAAVPLLPHCAQLDREQNRNEASLLSACRLLEGDRLAAAEVFNRVELLNDVEGPDDASSIRHLFESDAVVDWAGQRNEGSGSAARFWATKIGEGEWRTLLYYDAIRGEGADRVRLTGLLNRPTAGSNFQIAKVEQIWTREGGNFVIERISVAPFETAPQN